VNTDQRVEELIEQLRAEHCRITPQRIALLKILVEDRRHPSASQLHEKLVEEFPTTSLATVYKTLNVLKSLGAIQEIGFSDGDNRYDLTNLEPHAHFVCIKCRRIWDAEIDCDMHAGQQAALRHGFQVMHRRIDFLGICQDCQEKFAGG